MKNILFVPIDNRPITYSLTAQIAAIYKCLNLSLPPLEFMGGLYNKAKIDEIILWLKNSTSPDIIVLSLDTIAYGGLVSSRRGCETFSEIKDRINLLKEVLKNKKHENKNLKIYATSSIMRISNNNVNEEEKEYWNLYGKKIFEYSYNFHRLSSTETDVPKEILNDYLKTRKRNFEINKEYINWLKDGVLDYLIFSKDDTGEFGLNVMEANKLQNMITSLPAMVKTGADEIPLGLLLKGITQNKIIKIKPVYSYPSSINLISRYEDISVKKCIEGQITLAGAVIDENNPDLILYVNNFKEKQGDLVFRDVVNECDFEIPHFDKPYMIADINNANGADTGLIEKLFKKYNPLMLSYAGYNTSANTTGCALAGGIISYVAKLDNNFDENAHKEFLITRFLDDWGYQALQRVNYPNIDLRNCEKEVKRFLNFDFETEYYNPWNRSFEIGINIKKR